MLQPSTDKCSTCSLQHEITVSSDSNRTFIYMHTELHEVMYLCYYSDLRYNNITKLSNDDFSKLSSLQTL